MPPFEVEPRVQRRRAGGDLDRGRIDAELAALESAMLELERAHRSDIASVHVDHRSDAINLVHYLALRQADIRRLQRNLGALGFSSLGRCEPHVLATVRSVRCALGGPVSRAAPSGLSFEEGREALDRNTDSLFGRRPPGRVTRIMVTLPTDAARDYEQVRHLVVSGMDVARVNGAHDDPVTWQQMILNVRKAAAETGRCCRVSMDLAGPKLRTGPLEEGPRVLRLRPQRDQRGIPVVPALVTLAAASSRPEEPGDVLPVDGDWLARRQVGDVVEASDTRQSPRQLRVVERAPGSVRAEVWDTTYLETGGLLRCHGDVTSVGLLPPLVQYHVLHVGDLLVLTPSLEPVVPWRHGQPGCARIGCTMPAALAAARPGQRVVLDDGKMTGVVESARAGEIVLRISRASPGGGRLRAEKAINLPDTELSVGNLSECDLAVLEVAAAHADMVALSFLRDEGDVDKARLRLRSLGAEQVGLILKIETTQGFSRLPEILLHAMRSPLVGVMIARGDLAVEAGYERLAEVQEEIMWLCEAAHLPVIWATEVLDRLARTGKPSRAEVTDAAMAQRAECVMLNKGPHVDTAIGVLDDILRRMSGHQRKKASLLRRLRSWDDN